MAGVVLRTMTTMSGARDRDNRRASAKGGPQRAKRVVAPLLAGIFLVGSGCTAVRTVEPRASVRPLGRGGDPQEIDTSLIASLTAFDACDDLLAYLHTEGAKVVGPYGFGGPSAIAMTARGAAASTTAGGAETSAAPASKSAAADDQASSVEQTGPGVDFSSTNVQEVGVDEPDIVKSDGRRLVTISAGRLQIIDLSVDQLRASASLALEPEDGVAADGQLLLAGDRVLVLRSAPSSVGIGTRPGRPVPASGIRAGDDVGIGRPFMQGPPRTQVTVVDIANPAAPRIEEVVTFDGDLVASRMVGGVARLVLRSGPPALPFLFPSGSEASVDIAAAANRRVIAGSTINDWLPGFKVGAGKRQSLTGCSDVRRPEVFSGVGMLSVVTLDADDPRPGPAATVIGAGETVYASTESLYVTSTEWNQSAKTDLHKFDIGDRVRTTYEASGTVKGRLLNTFAMSEFNGDLRVAATDDGSQESAVTVLRQSGSALEPIGSVGGLGRTERIYAVRFLGTRGYVVTFRQTDPLYVLDLSDPTAPVQTGELKIPGYSAYLHPVGTDRLIGIGQAANEQGRVQGLQVSLFDVSDAAAPKRLANAEIPQSRSEAEFDHHAFLYWPKTSMTVVPVQSNDGTSGAAAFTVTDETVVEIGRLQQRDRMPIRRSLVVGDRLLTLSETGLQSRDLATLNDRGWLVF